MNAKEKNKLSGIFLMAHGSFVGFVYLLAMIFFSAAAKVDPEMPNVVLGIIVIFVMAFSAIFVLPQIIGGWKMYKEQPNARNWGIVSAILASLSGFLGIAAGIFTLIFLFSEDGKRFYNSLGGKNFLNPAKPVDDLNFQNFQQQPREPYSWK